MSPELIVWKGPKNRIREFVCLCKHIQLSACTVLYSIFKIMIQKHRSFSLSIHCILPFPIKVWLWMIVEKSDLFLMLWLGLYNRIVKSCQALLCWQHIGWKHLSSPLRMTSGAFHCRAFSVIGRTPIRPRAPSPGTFDPHSPLCLTFLRIPHCAQGGHISLAWYGSSC